ncbi:phosphatase PAP2 family protein [Bifidobacterium samirii]|uniref:ABC transporter n=1 Tax=Bifidobacterium samirii TaxID=2306974 RepID=A0A430FV18_9BIFI|nr:phosphatase PAP2 family protein [Bifidobacterium samirii]RSX57376.1 ABC transporter [Bifidobacterium samirii]
MTDEQRSRDSQAPVPAADTVTFTPLHASRPTQNHTAASDIPFAATPGPASDIPAPPSDFRFTAAAQTASGGPAGSSGLPRFSGSTAPSDRPASIGNPSTADAAVERGLAALDPLAVRPRTSSRILCVILGLLWLAAAAGVWWLGVRTLAGQSYDEMVITGFDSALPDWMSALLTPFLWQGIHLPFLTLNPTIVIALILGIAALAVAAVRRRWWLLGQSGALIAACYAASLLKRVLPRPMLIYTETPYVNSAPSGHTIAAAAAGVLLILAVPRAWRAAAAIVAAAFASLVGWSVIAGTWHRPTDAVMSILIVGGLAMLALACTRASGMDDPGRRASSTGVQIVGTMMITAGTLACAYAAYVIWQILPGLTISAAWAASGAHLAAIVGVGGAATLTCGLVVALRQLTAAPLTRLGLIGAPPAPPSAS